MIQTSLKLPRSSKILGPLCALLFYACMHGAHASDLTVAATPTEAQSIDGSYIHWLEQRIDDEGLSGLPVRGADGFEVADFDRDGHLDVAIMYEDSNHLRIAFGGVSSDDWEVVTLAAGAEVQEIEDGAIGDLNNDGWPDLLVAIEGGRLLYLENPGANIRRSDWQRAVPVGVEGRGSWIRVYLADFNSDGRLEAAAANKGVTMPSGAGSMDVAPTPVSWFSIGDNPLDPAQWQEHELSRTVVPINAVPVDLDGDGDLDIVSGSRGESRMFWFENTTEAGSGDITFQEHAIEVTGRHVPSYRAPGALTGMNMIFTDMDKDGRLDIVTNETAFSLVWLQQPDELDAPWKINSIGVHYPDIFTGIAMADINGDGLSDVMAGGYSADPRDHDDPASTRNSRVGRIAWFQQPQDLSQSWAPHNISRRVRGMYDAFYFLDVDGDGLDDVMSTRGNSGEYDGLFWLKQQRSQQPQPAFTPAREVDSRSLPLPDGFVTKFVHWLLQ
jgi:hypothetical protein